VELSDKLQFVAPLRQAEAYRTSNFSLSGRYDKLPFVARPDKLKLIGHQTSVCRAATTS
jgi:hypothetical protein